VQLKQFACIATESNSGSISWWKDPDATVGYIETWRRKRNNSPSFSSSLTDLLYNYFRGKLFMMINTSQNCSVRRLFRFVTLSSYHGPVTYDKRLLMHQCDIETLIHCTGKWRFRNVQHRYVAASFKLFFIGVFLKLWFP
jgi:hypothetical protein